MYINRNPNYMKILKDKELYIFGAGINGRYTAHKFQKTGKIWGGGCCVKAFIDNSRDKIGSAIDGLKVISLDEFIQENTASKFVVVCGGRFEGEIAEQLLCCGVYNFVRGSDLDYGAGEEHYDTAYFEWQRPMGEFGAQYKLRMFFQKYITPEMSVLEFGSGGGFLLKELNVREKMGIDINDAAREFARTIGINSVKTISEVSDGWADVIISTSVLEHVENPLGVLRELRPKLKPHGRIIFHVPNESCETEYIPNNIDRHLYTWNCLNLGNLFQAAGYQICSVERVQERWPDEYQKIAGEVSEELFDFLATAWGKATDAYACLIVAKP